MLNTRFAQARKASEGFLAFFASRSASGASGAATFCSNNSRQFALIRG
jgi:hypothetical protein